MPNENHQLTEKYVVTPVPPFEEVYKQENFDGNLINYLNSLGSEKLNQELIESQKPKGNYSNKFSGFFSLIYSKIEKPTQATFQSYINLEV